MTMTEMSLQIENIISDVRSNLFQEVANDSITSTIIADNLYPKIEKVLSTPIGDRKFKQLVGSFIDKNSEKLHTPGPLYMITFGEIDKGQYFQLFNVTAEEVKKMVTSLLKTINGTSDFKLLTNNPIYWVFYCCVRYYTIKKDKKGINTALAIYCLSNYPLVFRTFYKFDPNPGVMQYTMDHLTNRYYMKQAGNLFGGLMLSINKSYDFLGKFITKKDDKEAIRFIQRIRNDQKSMIKYITSQYMENNKKGLRVRLSKDSSSDEIVIDDGYENNTTVVELLTEKIANKILISGLDLRRVSQAKEMGGISLADCRFYLSKIVTTKYTDDIHNFIHSILFQYLYEEKKTKDDINSSHFLVWASDLFRKTNSNDPNIANIKSSLDKWAEESGVYAKFKREASRINYKKAIFWYFVLSIQYYNK